MKRKTNFMSGQRLGLLILIVTTMLSVARAQETGSSSKQDPKQPQTASQPKTEDKKTGPAKPTFTLSVKTQPILNISIKAEKAKLAEIGVALSKKLKIPVFVGAGVEKELVSTEFSELTLEPAMQLLAPAVYIDYQILTGSGAPPRPLGVFFYAADQPEPSPTAIVTGSTQSLLIEGDTEEGVEPETEEERKKEEEQPLKVSFANNLMSVKAKKQPLALVLLKIGEELGIPVDIQSEAVEVVDIELSKMPVEDVVRRLSPNIQLFMRADLSRAERRALRVVLPEVPKAAQPDF
ncbi:MAG TPA: hypothetical protein VL866_09110 [Pyrinomonadaceae bacterium]|nr:hypothetical protein [Pyrinomonadaceae bacterium]